MAHIGQIDGLRRPVSTTMSRAIVISLGVHVAVIVAGIVSIRSAHSRKPVQNVIVTELVRIGKERPKDLLPRKDEPPPPPEKAEPPPQTKPTEPPPQTKPQPSKDATPSAKDRLSQLSKVQSALDRLKNQDEPEGREDGSQYGTAAKALAGNKFYSEVYACMKASYTLEGLTAGQAAGKTAKVVIRIDPAGVIRDADISQGSGDSRFDQNVIRSAKRCGKVSAPPAELARQLNSDGVELVFKP